MSNGINQIGIPKFQHPWRSLQTSRNSGTWGDRGKGNELQSALEKGLSWIGDKFVNGADYLEDGFNYLVTAPLAAVTGKTKEVPRVIDQMREQRRNMSQHYAMNPVFDLISPIKGGWMLKGLMKGSQLEKQLSKAGTININGLQAYLNKASKLEQDVIGKILKEQFTGQKNIDYNALRKAVSDELITYSRNMDPQSSMPYFSTEEALIYGGENLGLIKQHKVPDGAGGTVTTWDNHLPVTFKQFTFESSRIPIGYPKHYQGKPLGHSRTFVNSNEPDILYVMESQSDWAQNIDLKSYQDFEPIPDFPFNDLIENTRITEQYRHLANNYIPRQIQENMKYAAEQGQKRMRYPTSETAAKIEGYKKTYPEPEYSMLKQQSEAYQRSFENGAISYDRYLELTDRVIKRLREIQGQGQSYSPEHQTILKKYSDFPKMFNKLFKGQEVRTVTDPKGNTWYEVDIPENFLESEWQFKKGGVLGLNKIIGL